MQKAWEWRSRFNSQTIEKKYGKFPPARGSKLAKILILRYPVADLLQQLPAITHQDVKKLGDSSGYLVIRHKSKSHTWDKLDEMVKEAADLSIPKRLDEDSAKKTSKCGVESRRQRRSIAVPINLEGEGEDQKGSRES